MGARADPGGAGAPVTMKPKRPRDPNQLAKLMVDIAVGDVPNDSHQPTSSRRAGGLKGGRARAKKLTPQARRTIAKKGAAARWSKGRG